MKKFQFPLQAILTLRSLKQEQALEVYAKSVQDCALKRTEMLSATRRADDFEAILSSGSGTTYSASMYGAYLNALDASREEVKRLEGVLANAEKVKDKNLAEYLERKRQREILEHLREKQLKAHLAEGYRKDEIEIEDLVIARRSLAQSA
jgi:flagellar FliJ protein